LEALDFAGTITPEVLFERRIIAESKYPVKILGVGELSRAINIRAHKFSAGAREKIEATGGTAEVID